ncbi:MAG: transposase, partial [Bacteroidales bacterium]
MRHIKMRTRSYPRVDDPPFCKLMMFKALLIQGLYNLSDDQLEYQIVDRASFKRFLGLKKSDKVPDIKTFWVVREYLIEKEVIEKGYRNKPLTEEQKASNKEKSRTRVRVEHLFGFIENSM